VRDILPPSRIEVAVQIVVFCAAPDISSGHSTNFSRALFITCDINPEKAFPL
jgi:hypothetical protein